MAKKKNTEKAPSVYCADCKHFKRDTEGISRSTITGEYFMGICKIEINPDSPRKQFANKPRNCKGYKALDIAT